MLAQQHKELYSAQETVYSLLQNALGTSFQSIKLCGGTPLARCYLHHRISYDLDFFLPPDQNLIETLQTALKKTDINFVTEEAVVGRDIYSQLFGHVSLGSIPRIDVSFIEDRWFYLFPPQIMLMGETEITTEPVEGLYHRKLRTVSGYGSDKPTGGRQTARDIFDLYVLSKTVESIPSFIKTLDHNFSEDAFYNGLAWMDWSKISREITAMTVAPQWDYLLEPDNLIKAIMNEVDMTVTPDWEQEALEAEDDSGPCF